MRLQAVEAIFFLLVCFGFSHSHQYHEKTRFDRSIDYENEKNARIHVLNKKPRIFTDLETQFTAYKDTSQNVCYLEKLRGNELDELNFWQDVILGNNKKLYISDLALTKIEAWRLAGGRIVEFCKGMSIHQLTETKPDPRIMEDPFYNELPADENDIVQKRVADVVLHPLKARAKRQALQEERERLNEEMVMTERRKRDTRGRFRGQTQSQYMNIAGADGSKEGKAEAEATQHASRAVVSGSSGMGQAQSMSSGSDGCDGCPGVVFQGGTYPGTQGTYIPGMQTGTMQPGGGITYPSGATMPGGVYSPGTQIAIPGGQVVGGGGYPGTQITGGQPGVQVTGRPPTQLPGGQTNVGLPGGQTNVQIPGGQPATQIPGGTPTGIPGQYFPGAQMPGGATYPSLIPGTQLPNQYPSGVPGVQYPNVMYPGLQYPPGTQIPGGGTAVYPPGMQVPIGPYQPGTQVTGSGGVTYPPGTPIGGPGTQVYQPGIQGPGGQVVGGGGQQLPGGGTFIPGIQVGGGGQQTPGGTYVPGTQIGTGGGTYIPGTQYGTGGQQVTGGGTYMPGTQIGTGGQQRTGGTYVPGTQIGTGGQQGTGGTYIPGTQIGTGGQQGTGSTYVPGTQIGTGGQQGTGGTYIPGTQVGTGGGTYIPGTQIGTGGQQGIGGTYMPGTQIGTGGQQGTGGTYIPGTQIGTVGQQGTGGTYIPGTQVGTGGGTYMPGTQIGTGGQQGTGGTYIPGTQVGTGGQQGTGGTYVPGTQIGTGGQQGTGGTYIPGTQVGTGSQQGTGGGIYMPGTTGPYPPGTQVIAGGVAGVQISGGVANPPGTPIYRPGGEIGTGGYQPGQQVIAGGVSGVQIPPGGYPSGQVGGTQLPTGVYYPPGSQFFPGTQIPGQVPAGGIGGTFSSGGTIITSGGQQKPPTRGDIPGQTLYPGGQTDTTGGGGGGLPIVLPGQQVYPGGYPTAIPGQYPTAIPGQYPTTIPGQYPTTIPGQYPNAIPGQFPGSGTIPGQVPPGTFIPGGQTVSTPGVIPAVDDNSDSQAISSVKQGEGGTMASATAEGRHGSGNAKSHVSGTYTGSGGFSAEAGTSDNNKSAQTQVSGGKEGAKSSAQGSGGLGKSQVQVELDSDSGATSTNAQSSGWNHGTNSQIQASGKGGMADAQANGEGQTSSQAQIGFQPYVNRNEKFERLKNPFRGGGSAMAQSGTYRGQSQSQLQGSFHYGISYNGAAQANSGSGSAALRKPFNFTNDPSLFKPFKFDKPGTTTETSSTERLEGSSSTRQTVIAITAKPERKSKLEPFNRYDRDDEEYEEEYDDEDYGDTMSSTTPRHTTYQPTSPGMSRQTMRVITDGEYDVSVKRQQTTERSLPGYVAPDNQSKVVSIAGKKTIAQGDGKSQSQTVQIIPATPTPKVEIKHPSGDTRSLQHTDKVISVSTGKSKAPADDPSTSPRTSFVSVTNSVAGKIEDKNTNAEEKKYEHRYYTKSSTCGYFTFSCNVVYGSNGRRKICKPKLPSKC